MTILNEKKTVMKKIEKFVGNPLYSFFLVITILF